jgi:hypothetical protein
MNVQVLENTLTSLRRGDIVDFNLGDLVIDERRVFNMGKIKRRDMPQLRGFPIEGSLGMTAFDIDKKGKIDVSQAFVAWLRRVHKAQVLTFEANPKFLNASQSELVASKVAHHVPKLMADNRHKKFTQTYYTSADNTLLDGHHGWAAVRCFELLTGNSVKLNAKRIMMPTDQLIELAREFTSFVGVEAKEGV